MKNVSKTLVKFSFENLNGSKLNSDQMNSLMGGQSNSCGVSASNGNQAGNEGDIEPGIVPIPDVQI